MSWWRSSFSFHDVFEVSVVASREVESPRARRNPDFSSNDVRDAHLWPTSGERKIAGEDLPHVIPGEIRNPPCTTRFKQWRGQDVLGRDGAWAEP
jgi:hypothetical protein